MVENGITDKDQLQCRTHGQKYLLSLADIHKNLEGYISGKITSLDKKIYQKIQRYEDDKRYLYNLYLKDQALTGDKPKILAFQDDASEGMFWRSIPGYIRNTHGKKKTPSKLDFSEKVVMIRDSVGQEIEQYDYLKNLKKDLNKRKRMTAKHKGANE